MCLGIMVYSSKKSFDTLFLYNLPTTLLIGNKEVITLVLGRGNGGLEREDNVPAAALLGGTEEILSPVSEGNSAFFLTTLSACGMRRTSSALLHVTVALASKSRFSSRFQVVVLGNNSWCWMQTVSKQQFS